MENKKYDWENENFDPQKDPFLRQFDEDGNFIELSKELPKEADDEPKHASIRILFNYKKDSENKQDGL